ncbi:YedE family putative selenium transporter [Fuchsiella alkaliacetigena]|uniref:YedE family putative selenium transporter n=1 Tax=Fuchsiella alkaliacetigena TaxID=957042 RepID=UPI00200B63A3|nr:YedE family putative selenium transporter [Fuchsiella alkaliacetigena]MCK8826102.1 YedE family putative selenium transporter [Fuchsiella alkaliacetigena]
MDNKKEIIFAGLVIGILSSLLVKLGNPVNMGICVACFVRDIAGGIGLHRAGVVQYIRPEVIGFILGAFIIAALNKEFKVRGGSSPLLRFILGILVMIGALVFLGCPLRMVLRLAGGDLNAIAGILGFATGIIIGAEFIKRGFTLGRSHEQSLENGYILPLIAVLLLSFLVIAPDFIFFSTEGPGAMQAAILIALAAGLIVGVLAQRSRICMVGGIRDLYLIKDPHLIIGFIAIFIAALILNLALGYFNLGFIEQPIAHNDGLWNFLGMLLAGLGSILLGGCPLRQTVLAGEGNIDSGITFIGMLVGAAISHNFALAGSPDGVGANGKIAVVIGIIIILLIGFSKLSIGASKKGGVTYGK